MATFNILEKLESNPKAVKKAEENFLPDSMGSLPEGNFEPLKDANRSVDLIKPGASSTTDDDDLMEAREAKMLLLGVGGCGGNVIQRIIESGRNNIDFLAINTDVQDLRKLPKTVKKIQIGHTGLGAGGVPDEGRRSAMDRMNDIQKFIEPYDAIFLAAGLGGGTGSGAAPAIAQMIAERGDKLLIASVTEPFEFEGDKRKKQAKAALDELRKYVDSLIVVPNDKITEVDPDFTREQAFKYSDEVLANAIYSITLTIQETGAINVDFKDVWEVLKKGDCQSYIGVGQASGDKRIQKVVDKALSSITVNNLENCKASAALIILLTTKESPIREFSEVKECIGKKIEIDEDANIIFGLYNLIEGTYDTENPPVELFVILSGIQEKNAMGSSYAERTGSTHIPNPGIRIPLHNTEMKLKGSLYDSANQPKSQLNVGPLFKSEERANPGTPKVLDNYLDRTKTPGFSIRRDGFAS